jgi:serine/threonine protein kinase
MAPASLEGQTLGKYRVLEPLGRGGMARVYRAYHPQLDRYVAIKVLRADLVEMGEIKAESWRARFRREAQAVAALRHPHIVQVFDFDVQDDVYYMVMELLEGDTLKTRLNDYRVRDERMGWGESVRVLLDVLDGLAYAHSEGMVHRDIKPSNVLLTRRGQAVLADFGIAQIVGGTRHTASGALLGTFNYMAPEQGLEGRSDARSDVYALGIVLYEMLTQRTPFEADTPLAVLMKHVNDPLPLPRAIDPTIPQSFERVVLKALAKEPEDRYQSAEEMARALRGAAEEAEVELPQRISLPLSFSTPEAPSESVAVFSGTAREHITDVQFAADDTAATLSQRLAAGGARGWQALGDAGKELLGAVGAMAHGAVNRATEGLQDAVESARQERDVEGAPEPPPPPRPPEPETPAPAGSSETVERAKPKRGGRRAAKRAARQAKQDARQAKRAQAGPQRRQVVVAILGAVALLVASNLCMLTLAAPMGYWQIFERGWPIQIFLVAWGLCAIMYVTSSIWMTIPIGLLLGTGTIFAYCTITGRWEHWDFLWLFEIWVAVVSVAVPILLSKLKGIVRELSRLLAVVFGLASIIGIGYVGLGVGVGSLLGGLRRLILP